jgi:hypothetical protein
MGRSLTDVLAELRTQAEFSDNTLIGGVNVTLMILSQVDLGPDGFSGRPSAKTWYGHGFLIYVPAKLGSAISPWLPGPFRSSPGENEYLATVTTALWPDSVPDFSFRVLNNSTYSMDVALRGPELDYQTFLATEPASELWSIHIEISRARRFFPSQITLTLADRPDREPWPVTLTEDNLFLRGVGPDVLVSNEEALYGLAFGSTVTGLITGYQLAGGGGR